MHWQFLFLGHLQKKVNTNYNGLKYGNKIWDKLTEYELYDSIFIYWFDFELSNCWYDACLELENWTW